MKKQLFVFFLYYIEIHDIFHSLKTISAWELFP